MFADISDAQHAMLTEEYLHGKRRMTGVAQNHSRQSSAAKRRRVVLNKDDATEERITAWQNDAIRQSLGGSQHSFDDNALGLEFPRARGSHHPASSEYSVVQQKLFVCGEEACKEEERRFNTANELDDHRRACHFLGSLGTSFRCASRNCRPGTMVLSSFEDFRKHIEDLHGQEDHSQLISQSRWVLPLSRMGSKKHKSGVNMLDSPSYISTATEEDHEMMVRSMARRRKSAIPAGDASHICRDCKKEFKRPCDLTKHEKIHSRPWKCSQEKCKYFELGWPTKKELDRHVNDKHSTAPAQYKCLYPPCSYASKRESNCKQHMEKAHGWKYVRPKPNARKKSPTTTSSNLRGPPDTVPSTIHIETPKSFFKPSAVKTPLADALRQSSSLTPTHPSTPSALFTSLDLLDFPDMPRNRPAHEASALARKADNASMSNVFSKNRDTPKIAMKCTIAEDCSREKQYRKDLLSCLRNSSSVRPDVRMFAKLTNLSGRPSAFVKGGRLGAAGMRHS